jgi:hypothetical protein
MGNRRRPNLWIVASTALALALLLCVPNLLALPYTRRPVFPCILTPIAGWITLDDGTCDLLSGLLLWPIPLAILTTNASILIIARIRGWYPLWLAWAGLAAPVAILGSVLMAFAVSLPCFVSYLPLSVVVAASSALGLVVAKRKGWGPLWPWAAALLFSGPYAFFVSLALLLHRLGVVHSLL